ncbi:MAG: hypothetical protein Q9210_003162 [Variospora velana]
MPAASSFADGGFMSHGIDLNVVNEQLRWNPHSQDREAVQHLFWDRGSLEPPQTQASLLSSAIHSAEFYARRLAEHPDGRLILTNENPGQGGLNPRYWSARAAFYKAEYERLEREDQERRSRSVTPGYVYPGSFGDSELDRAKGHAENAAFRLASLPEGKAFLDTEDHGAFAGDPDYWRQKEREYHEKYSTLPKESALDRARRHADTVRKKVANFPDGRALLQTANHEVAESNVEYWRSMEHHYHGIHKGLQEDFWIDWKRTTTGSKGMFQLLSAPAPTSNRRPVTRSYARHEEEKEHPSMTKTASFHESCTTSTCIKPTPSQAWRGHRDAYRLRSTASMKAISKPQPSGRFVTHGRHGLSTPNSYELRGNRLAEERADFPNRLRDFKGTVPRATLNLLQPCVPRVSRRHKGVAARRAQCRSMRDSAYHGTKPIPQPFEPISSRLRCRERPRQHQ